MTLREHRTITPQARPVFGGNAGARAFARAPGSRRGFSLMEFGMVLGVVAVVAVVVVPRYANSQARYRAEMAIQRVAEDLKRAQAIARSSSSSITVTFNPGSPRYTVKPASGSTWSAAQFKSRSDSLTDLAPAPYLGTISDAQFGVDAAVSFDAFGNADSAGVVVLQAGDWGAGLKMNADGTMARTVFRWPTVASPIATHVPAEIASVVPASPRTPAVIDESAPDPNAVAVMAGVSVVAPVGGGAAVVVDTGLSGSGSVSLTVGAGSSTSSSTTTSTTTSTGSSTTTSTGWSKKKK